MIKSIWDRFNRIPLLGKIAAGAVVVLGCCCCGTLALAAVLPTTPTPVAQATSAAPVPTSAPASTDTPLPPTATAPPTATLAPSDTPAPTDTPEPTSTPEPVLPVSSFELEGALIQLGFDLDFGADVDGKAQRIGKSSNGLALAQLIGLGDEMTKASITVAVPSDNQDAILQNTAYILVFMATVLPDWDARGEWLTAELNAASQTADDYESSIVQDGVLVEFSVIKSLGFVTLVFSGVAP